MTYKISNKSQLESFIVSSWDEVNQFLDSLNKHPLPFYTSVDIRESLINYAPVDNNLYPAGFNNICMIDLNMTAEKIKQTILTLNPGAKNIGIICESHTKNKFYLDHLSQLQALTSFSDFQATLISFDETLFEDGKNSLGLVSQNESKLTIYKANVSDGLICVKDESIDFAILNNDQSQPINVDWNYVKTPVHPSSSMGWNNREKITHFEHYKIVADAFCEKFDIQPCLIQARFRSVHDIDFMTKEGIDILANAVDDLKKEISSEQKIFIKASQGTYGMGIMVVDSGADVISMNRKARNKMDIGKNKIKFTSALVQEGIETAITHDGGPAEITIYLISGKSVGGFMRANPEKDSKGNLNSRGMVYQKFCISEIHEGYDHKAKEAVYSTIARLSTIAASNEIHETKGKLS